MAKFCTKCGKKLEDGKQCTCHNNQDKQTETVSGKFDFNEYLNHYIDIIKGIFTKPIDTIKKFTNIDNFKLGLIAIILNCIITGIFIYCLCNESLGAIMSLFSGFSTSSILGGMEIPFMRVFLYSFFSSAVQFAVLGVVLYIMVNTVFKDKVDIKKIFTLVGVCSVFTTVTTLIATVCIYISFTLTFVVIALASLFYTIYLYHGLSDITEVDKNKLGFVFVPSIAVAAFVVIYILPKIIL